MLACTLQVMCQRWAVSLDAVVDWSAKRGTTAIGPAKPCRKDHCDGAGGAQYGCKNVGSSHVRCKKYNAGWQHRRSTTHDGRCSARVVSHCPALQRAGERRDLCTTRSFRRWPRSTARSKWCSSTTAARTTRSRSPRSSRAAIRACASSSSGATTARRRRWRRASSTRTAKCWSPWTAICRTIRPTSRCCSSRSTPASTSWSAGATTARTSSSRARFPRASPTGSSAR